METDQSTVVDRAKQTAGASSPAILAVVAKVLKDRGASGTIVDVGCGTGDLWSAVESLFTRYVGADVIRHDGFPAEAEFLAVYLDSGTVPLADGSSDVVASVETIEQVENPRAQMRELTRVCRPGGWVVLTTPNQLSLLSKMTLLLKNEFNAFRERPGLYPAHITTLLEVDLRRMAFECGLSEIEIVYTRSGRIPGTRWHYPGIVARLLPRACSDNILLAARRPEFPSDV